MRLLRLVFLLVLPLLCAVAVRAQAVRWELADDPNNLVLTFENCSPDGDPQLPSVDGVQFSLTGHGTRTEFNNFHRTDYVQLTYRFRARNPAPVTIPTFDVQTDKGTLHVAAFTTGANQSSGLDNAATSRLMPATATVWAGEVFPLTYTLDVIRRNFSQLSPTIEWNPVPLITEEWSKPEATEMMVNGESRFAIAYKSRALAKTPGIFTIGSATQLVNLQTGSIGFGIFQTPRVEQVNVSSNQPRLTVRALPAPAPAGFSGAVGDFKLVSKIIPDTAAVGEPVTWTLELSGTGNWPDLAGLSPRDVSRDFQVVQPKAKRTPVEGKLFDATLAEDVVLVPTKAGTYTLGPVNFAYFDPKSGSYKTITAPRTTLNITAPNAPQPLIPAPSATEPARPTPETVAKSATPPAVPTAPAGIPRDPLPGSEAVRTPLDSLSLLVAVAVPFALLICSWLWLAVRRAQQTDPGRARREARARLAATLAQLRNSPPSTLNSELLLAWQHDAIVLFQIAHAAPPATALPVAAWVALWGEVDRTLYGAKSDLPSDWVARAEAALAAMPVPGFNPLRVFLPRNLLPFAALLLIALLPLAALRAADSPSTSGGEAAVAYRRGEFSAAEKSWRAALTAAPTDWIARHNVALALAQQDRWSEAAAQASAAFVQNPADASVHWHFMLTTEKAGFVPTPLVGFFAPGPLPAIARLSSPALWQFALVASAIIVAGALGWMLANSYGRRSRLVLHTSRVALLLGILLAVTALLSLREFGQTADTRAVVVLRAGILRSIPTEADTTQKTTPVAAGSVALADKTFLGWTRLAFENGQTGWIRREELVALWK